MIIITRYIFCFVTLLSLLINCSCSLFEVDTPNNGQDTFSEGLNLPREKYGGFYSYEVPWVFSVHSNGKLSHYEIDRNQKSINISFDNIEVGRPFRVYLDRLESWEVLKEIIGEVRQKNMHMLYIACQASSDDEKLKIESLEIQYRDIESVSNASYIDVLEDGRISFNQKLYQDYKSTDLIDAIVSHSGNKDSHAVFLRNGGGLSVESYINLLAYIRAHANIQIFYPVMDVKHITTPPINPRPTIHKTD